jgi:hypothetical protein
MPVANFLPKQAANTLKIIKALMWGTSKTQKHLDPSIMLYKAINYILYIFLFSANSTRLTIFDRKISKVLQ